MQNKWQPTANIAIIKQRAEILNTIRNFFKKHNVLEVETPMLSQYSATAPYIDPIAVVGNEGFKRFLQTSPEYAMKRLLAAGIGDIFQLSKVFRGMEVGKLHNPEFTMLEWYRIGVDHHKLMEEMVELFRVCGINYEVCKISYREIFIKYLQIDPVLADLQKLKTLVYNNIKLSEQFKNSIINATKQDCQELLFNHCIEPNLELNKILFIYNYPKEQAALAKVNKDQDGVEVAERFEVYINGVELANGYHELLDPVLQEQRFLADQDLRKKLGKPHLEIDPYLIAALKHGMPSCSGVALGIERLLMLIIKTNSIRDVLCFPWDIA
ncbi:MAG: EF-P lysine aminoacylase EpmA [Gammaproteobacteria bacterium]